MHILCDFPLAHEHWNDTYQKQLYVFSFPHLKAQQVPRLQLLSFYFYTIKMTIFNNFGFQNLLLLCSSAILLFSLLLFCPYSFELLLCVSVLWFCRQVVLFRCPLFLFLWTIILNLLTSTSLLYALCSFSAPKRFNFHLDLLYLFVII